MLSNICLGGIVIKRKLLLVTLFFVGLFLVGCSGTGSVLIETSPRNAQVYIENKLVGTTPLHIPEVSAGGHNVTIRQQGYYPKSVRVAVQADRHTIVSETLVPQLSTVVSKAMTLSQPEHPVQLLLLRSFGRLSENVEQKHYWGSFIEKGDAELSIIMIELMVATGFLDISLKIGLMPNADEATALMVGGTTHLWSKTRITDDVYLVNPRFLQEQDAKPGGFVVIKEANKWKLLRMTNSPTTSPATVLRENEEWVQDLTQGMFAGDSSDSKAATNDQQLEVEPGWRTIKKWSGKGMKQTETFEVENHEWQIEWSATNEDFFGFLGVYLYKENGSLVSILVNQTGEGDGSTYIRGAGRYYLDIQGANIDWDIRVLDYK